MIARTYPSRSGHFRKQLFVVINDVLAADHRREVHLNSKLSTPGSKVLKNLRVSRGFEQQGDPSCSWSMDAEEHFKTVSAIGLRHFARIPEFTETLVGSQLAFDIWKNAVGEVHLHGRRERGPTKY